LVYDKTINQKNFLGNEMGKIREFAAHKETTAGKKSHVTIE